VADAVAEQSVGFGGHDAPRGITAIAQRARQGKLDDLRPEARELVGRAVTGAALPASGLRACPRRQAMGSASRNSRVRQSRGSAPCRNIVDNPELTLDPAVRPRIRAGAQISARDYLQTLAERERLKAEFAAATAHIDALLAPVTTTPAIPLAAVDQTSTPAVLTRWVNFLDLCALAVPAGFNAAGLPIGLQIVCRGGDEALALRIGWAWQNATDWHERLPPLGR
jgi:Asp-tRNA(Asn)/Glu-tRNA(Gln) amidotransferase A subunit family amidase